MDIKKLKKNGAMIVHGGWIKSIPVRGVEDLALKVRGADNVDARDLRLKLFQELNLGENEVVPDAELVRITNEVMLETILLDWNLKDGDEPVPYDKETARGYLTDPEIGEIMRNAVHYASNLVATKGQETLEADAKN
jgi:hypothetical protein